MAHQVQGRLHYPQNHIYFPACLPLFISETLHPSRTLRSSVSKLLFVPLVRTYVSVFVASLLPLQLFGTPFLWPFVVVASPLTVFGANSKLSSITLLSGLLNAPPHLRPEPRSATDRLLLMDHASRTVYRRQFATRHCL